MSALESVEVSTPILTGAGVRLHPATPEDRRSIYEWLACSDVTAAMIGPPLFPEHPVPTWEQFQEEYADHFFDDSAPELGRCFQIRVDAEAAGQVSYNDLFEVAGGKRVELDIWLRSRAWCGRGIGPDALETLCRYLEERFGVTEFMVQPSARNPAAIRAYEKAGFSRIDLPLEALAVEWGPADYPDSVYLVRRTRRGG